MFSPPYRKTVDRRVLGDELLHLSTHTGLTYTSL